MKWMNLPTSETMFTPVEDWLNGKLVCDMAIGRIGKLRQAVKVTPKNGII